jgi:haloalkane dehalogenase
MWTRETIAWCRDTIAFLEIVEREEVAGHHTPEDQPLVIAEAIAEWTAKHR